MDEATIARVRINRNITTIKSTLSADIDSIIDKLMEKDIVTPENKEQLSSEPNRFKRVDEVLRIIRSRGQRAFDIFMDILIATHSDLHGIIMRTTIDPGRDAACSRHGHVNSEVRDLLLEMKTEMKEGFKKSEESIKEEFKKNEDKIKEEFKKSEEKMKEMSDQIGRQDQICREHETLLNDHKTLIEELSFLREEITNLKKETEELGMYKDQLNMVLEKYKELRKESDIIPELLIENATLKAKNDSLSTEIKNLKDCLSCLRRTVNGRYNPPLKTLPPIPSKKAN